MKVCPRFKVTVLLYIAQEALVKFANLREKIFPQKFAYQAGEIKKKTQPAGGSETKVFFTSALSSALSDNVIATKSDAENDAVRFVVSDQSDNVMPAF